MAGILAKHPSAKWARMANRFQARLATWSRPATAFTSHPEPRTIGSFAKGRQLVAGTYLFAGYLVEAQGDERPIWDLPAPAPEFTEALMGFSWLDDLAAVGDLRARKRAQGWTWVWIERFGRGRGPGWTPDLTGRRLIRWINHAIFLLNGRSSDQSEAYFRALAGQTRFLSRRWRSAAPGLPRFEALTGLIYAGLALQGMEGHVDPALKALSRECDRQVDAQGGIPTRNPEELMEVLTLLTWAVHALVDADHPVPRPLTAAIARITPTLRALRHSDGGLARFHGGGRGLEGRLDAALAASGVREGPGEGLSMGYARLAAGRTTVIVDAARPPRGPASARAHASTLGFELTSGRRPLIVSCGSGASFGEGWRRAGRATASHATLAVERYSSSRLAPAAGQRGEFLEDTPGQVKVERTGDSSGAHLLAGHDGYASTHGLTHMRRLDLDPSGRLLTGTDTLRAFTEDARKAFDAAMTRMQLQGVSFTAHFHLHPDVDATVDMGGLAVSLALKSGEIWVFRYSGKAELSLEPSVYLEQGRIKPRAARQIVLSAKVLDYGHEIGWTLAKAQDTPLAIRDTLRDDDDEEDAEQG
ncbi:heparinase II/III family protein [Vannielia litorea]|nr:heparinase II/III family protein [Vannielia litorea]MBY6076621.1 heparinase II/III family protein [Vannielia litorea]